ncbi:hypothetical protein B0H14DRAFT_3705523 [Mycena olivaceomarginata]|nr:hypothetical protein B0H14DRAFT_3705523 [Mycena olivaceomarginata]
MPSSRALVAIAFYFVSLKAVCSIPEDGPMPDTRKKAGLGWNNNEPRDTNPRNQGAGMGISRFKSVKCSQMLSAAEESHHTSFSSIRWTSHRTLDTVGFSAGDHGTLLHLMPQTAAWWNAEGDIGQRVKGVTPFAYYNWRPEPSDDATGLSVEFVPMLWGKNQTETFSETINDTISALNVTTVLGMNENELDRKSLPQDSYGTNATAFKEFLVNYHENMQGPQNQCSMSDVTEFMRETQEFMNQMEWVERYAWYGAKTAADMHGVNIVRGLLQVNLIGRAKIWEEIDSLLVDDTTTRLRLFH